MSRFWRMPTSLFAGDGAKGCTSLGAAVVPPPWILPLGENDAAVVTATDWTWSL